MDDTSSGCDLAKEKHHKDDDLCSPPSDDPGTKDSNCNTLPKKNRKNLRRIAIGFPSEIDEDRNKNVETESKTSTSIVQRHTSQETHIGMSALLSTMS